MQMASTEKLSDEMSLGDLARMLGAGWRLILGALSATLLLTGFYLAVTPKQHEATLIVRLGQIGTAHGVKPIEDANDVIARMQSLEFQRAVIESLGWKSDERAKLLRSSLRISNPASGKLNIRVRGFSTDEARQAVNASLAVLVGIHDEQSKRISALRNRDLSNVQSDIADSEAFLRDAQGLDQRGRQSTSEMAATTLLKVTKDEKSRLRDLHARHADLKEAMRPELNKPTLPLEPAVVSDAPIYPNTRRVWLFAAFAGLALGLFLVTIRSINRMNQNSERPAQ
jgi:uncharacterized protein involved in exopolysaccharide biosynthesis